MHFRSLADLQKTVLTNLHRVPRDVDLIVGIPRSGMLPAMLLSLALDIQVTDLQGFREGRVMRSGRTPSRARDKDWSELQHALVVDDSIDSGGSMQEARELLAAAGTSMKLTFAAIYGTEGGDAAADLVFEEVGKPRVFEWNVLHHSMLSCACVDIDGVLCHDPTGEENDDGPAYVEFLRNARPLFTPTKRIETLVTSRLEKYRPQTEEWLRERGIEYDRLVMLDLPDAATRRKMGVHGHFKGDVYKSLPSSRLFIESELGQARKIAEISGKPVLCMDGPVMCYPGTLNPRGVMQRARQSPRVRQLVARLIGQANYARLVGRFGRRPAPAQAAHSSAASQTLNQAATG